MIDQSKGKLTEISVTSEAREVTIDRALKILAAAKEADPDASVDVIIYHIVEEIHVAPICPECDSSRVCKDGLRRIGSGVIQRYLCRSCGFRFSESTVGALKDE